MVLAKHISPGFFFNVLKSYVLRHLSNSTCNSADFQSIYQPQASKLVHIANNLLLLASK